MPELTPEDALRLNVLLAGEIHAVRIDDVSMAVHALTPKGDALVRLHPQGRNDQYLRMVRELLSGHAAGSPGGYPVYLQRWTRMGQARRAGLDRLLLFGEPEAVVSVAYSNGLTDELARRVWWAMPTADNARRMLERSCVWQGKMGKVLADYLIEHLPFETNPYLIIDTVRLVLQPGLTSDEARRQLWAKGRGDNAYFVGFLERIPNDLPESHPPRHDWALLESKIGNMENRFSKRLLLALSEKGQAFLAVAEEVLRYPADRDVVNSLLSAISSYFSDLGDTPSCTSPECALEAASRLCDAASGELGSLLSALPEYSAEVRAMLALGFMDRNVAQEALSRTTAGGTLLRQKLEPVSIPILKEISVLRGQEFSSNMPRRRRASVVP